MLWARAAAVQGGDRHCLAHPDHRLSLLTPIAAGRRSHRLLHGCPPSAQVTLPPSWADSSVGRLLELVARQRNLPPWDIHLDGPRGPVANDLPLRAAIVRQETARLERGPPPALDAALAGDVRTSLWTWGRGVDGVVREKPARVIGTGLHSIRRIALGSEHALALAWSGLVLSWGGNDCGQLGDGTELPRNSPEVSPAPHDASRGTPLLCQLHAGLLP